MDIDRKKEELISSIADEAFRGKLYRQAYNKTKDPLLADDYVQDAILRCISAINNKKSPEELKPIEEKLDAYFTVILNNIHADRQKNAHVMPQSKRPHQTGQPQEDTSEKPGHQKRELLESQMGQSVEDIANHQQEGGKIGSTSSEVEEQVLSEISVKEIINSLPENLRELARLLNEGYKLHEIAERLNVSYNSVIASKSRIKKFLRSQEQ